MHRIILLSFVAAAGLTDLACDSEPTWSSLGASEARDNAFGTFGTSASRELVIESHP
jgi:hypothetical protein